MADIDNISGIDLLVLILIAQGASHGYQIERIIKMSHARRWVRIGTSTVYQSLERLTRKGLADTVLDTSSLPAKRLHTVTDEGMRLMREKALDFLSQGESIYSDMNLGLAAFPFLDPADVSEGLRSRRSELSRLLEEAEGFTVPTGAGEPIHQRWIRLHTIHMLKAELDWTDALIIEQIGNDSTTGTK